MALVECPDCGRKISDRARECPDCMCPVAEVLEAARADAERDRIAGTRKATERDVDCAACEARGWIKQPDGMVGWCITCEHSGRVLLCTAEDGFYAVARYAIERFVAGEIHPETSGVCFFLGAKEPTAFRYPQGGERMPIDEDAIPWVV